MDERDIATAVFTPTQDTAPPKQDAVAISRLALKALAIAFLCSFLGALAARASPEHSGRGSSSCSAHRKHSVAVGPQMIVYAKSAVRFGEGTLTTYYACTLPAGKPLVLGRSQEGEEYPAELSFSDFHIAGTYVADLSVTGLGGADAVPASTKALTPTAKKELSGGCR